VIAAPGRDATFTVTGPGADVWTSLEQPQSVRSLVGLMGEQYSAPPASIEADVTRLLGELCARDAISYQPDPGPAVG
jgi:hypothetical protein